MVTNAVASEPQAPTIGVPFTAPPATGEGTDLVSRLGNSRTAGSWVDKAGRPVVAVTDDKAAAEVKRAGAQARMVEHSMSDLKSAAATLRSAPRVSGTSWAMDYKSNQVVVRGDSTVSSSDWSRMTKVAEGIGSFVRMERSEGTFTTRVNGAQPILSTAGRCSAGFNVTDGKSDFILTAGHCGPDGSVWFADDRGRDQIGTSLKGSFPGDDYSLVKYDGGRAGKGADVVAVGDGKGVRITGVADAEVGQKIFRSGSTSGLREGEVTALNATVNYPEGTVTGLIETNVCAEPGDSGGPMFADGVALGLTSGGSGDCTQGVPAVLLGHLGMTAPVADRRVACPSAQCEEHGRDARPQQSHRLTAGDPLVQQGEAQHHGKGRVEGGQDHGDGEQLPLGGEQIQHEAEGRPGSDEGGLGAADRRQLQPTSVPRGIRQEDEDGGDPARGDGPQAAPGSGLAEGEVLHGDAEAGDQSVRRSLPGTAPATGDEPQRGHRDGDAQPGDGTRTVAEDEDPAQHRQRDPGDRAHGHDDTHVAPAQPSVEEPHGGAAADAGQRAPQQVGRVDGVGGQQQRGGAGEQQPAQLAEEGDGGVMCAPGQQTAGEVNDAVDDGRGKCEKGTHWIEGALRRGSDA